MNYVLAPTNRDILHSGKGHDDNPPGRGSGRYPYGSGKRPHQDKEQHRLEKYKKRETKSLEKRKERYTKFVSKDEDRGKTNTKRYFANTERLRQIDAEIDAVRNMSFDEMTAEKKAVAKQAFNQYLVTALAGPLGGAIIMTASKTPTILDVKSKQRIGETVWDAQKIGKEKAKDAKRQAKVDTHLNKKSQTSNNTKSKLDLARKSDQYSIDFLEAVQNTRVFNENDKSSLLKEYEKYLNDPQDYWRNGRHKLEEY